MYSFEMEENNPVAANAVIAGLGDAMQMRFGQRDNRHGLFSHGLQGLFGFSWRFIDRFKTLFARV
jgi:hypothetical protein